MFIPPNALPPLSVNIWVTLLRHAVGDTLQEWLALTSYSYLNDYSSKRLTVCLDVQKHDWVLGGTGGKQPRSGDNQRAVSHAFFYFQHGCSADRERTLLVCKEGERRTGAPSRPWVLDGVYTWRHTDRQRWNQQRHHVAGLGSKTTLSGLTWRKYISHTRSTF